MPPSGSPSSLQTLHQSNSNLSKPVSSFSKPKYHTPPTQKKTSKNDGAKPQRSSYAAKKKKSKKKSQVQGSHESCVAQSRSISNDNETKSSVLAAHVLDQALENSLKNQRQKNSRRPHSHPFSQQRKDIEYPIEEKKSLYAPPTASKTPTVNDSNKKNQHRSHRGTSVASNSLSSSDTSSNSKKSPSKSSKSQSKSDNGKLPATNKKKEIRIMQSNNSTKSLITSSSRRKHNRSKHKANIAGDSCSSHVNKGNNSGSRNDGDQGTQKNKIATAPKTHRGKASHPPSDGNQAPDGSNSNSNKLKDVQSKKKKYHFVTQSPYGISTQNNEKVHNLHPNSRDLPSKNRYQSSSLPDGRNNATTKENTQRQPRCSRFFQKKGPNRYTAQKYTKSLQGQTDDEQCNPKIEPQHSTSNSRSQPKEEKSPPTEEIDQIRNIPQSLEVESTLEPADKTLPIIFCSKDNDKIHDQDLIAEEILKNKLHEMKIDDESKRENHMSKEDMQSEIAPTTGIPRSISNHSTISSMENITTTSFTTSATDMTTKFADSARSSRPMMPPNFHGNSNMIFHDEFYPYQPESYPNSQSACMVPPNHSFNDQGMFPYGIQMSYPIPYQHPMNSPLPLIPPQEYHNYHLYQRPNSYGPTPTDDRNDMMGLSNQISENRKENSYRVPFHSNDSDSQPFPSSYNQQMYPQSLSNTIETISNENESSMSKDLPETQGEPGFIQQRTGVMPNPPPNMPMFPPQMPFSGGTHPQFFGMNFQSPPQPLFMEHPLPYQPNMGMVHPHQHAHHYPPQNFMAEPCNENKEDYDKDTYDSNVQASASQSVDQNRNGYSKQ